MAEDLPMEEDDYPPVEEDDDSMSIDVPFQACDKNAALPMPREEDRWEIESDLSSEAPCDDDHDHIVPSSFNLTTQAPPPSDNNNPEFNEGLPEPPSEQDEESRTGSSIVNGSDSELFF